MNTITIPRKLAQTDDLIVLPRREYEALLLLRKFKEFNPNMAQKRALLRAENNLNQEKTLSYNELRKKLGFTS